MTSAAEPGQRAFQLATQLAYLECGPTITALADEGNFTGPEPRSLARIGLASYFAGALVLPYGRFLAAAEALHYDIELLAQRFGVSFETVCHRLSTLQRPDARGVPFFFVRVDRAGNFSKRQSATDFHFSHSGGTCPLWNVYEAFAQPHKVLTQLARMPDGRTYLWIARCVTRTTGGYGSAERTFAIGLGCDVRHASRLVYAKGLALADTDAATPIGAGCKVCDRQGCSQRAFPALGRGCASTRTSGRANRTRAADELLSSGSATTSDAGEDTADGRAWPCAAEAPTVTSPAASAATGRASTGRRTESSGEHPCVFSSPEPPASSAPPSSRNCSMPAIRCWASRVPMRAPRPCSRQAPTCIEATCRTSTACAAARRKPTA